MSKGRGSRGGRHRGDETGMRRTGLGRDQEKYGEVLFSTTYDVDVEIVRSAAALYGSPRMRGIAVGMVALGIVGLWLYLAVGIHHIVLLIASLIPMASGYVAARNWNNVQAWALMGSNLGASGDDVRRHVVVTPAEVIVEGPGAETCRYELARMRRVRHDANGCLASFGRGEVAYFPASKAGAGRLRALEQFLEEQGGQ